MKIIFLDRDGVINRFPGYKKYVTRLKDFRILPKALEAISRLTKAGFKIFVVSNQAGVSKGLYSKKKLNQMTDLMLKKIRSRGGNIKKVFYCLHRSEENCDCRKPKTGLIKKAMKIFNVIRLNKKEAFFIGDSIRDVITGRRSGCTTILVLSGRESMRSKRSWKPKPDFVARDLLEASKIILNENYHYPRISRPRPQALR